MMEYSWNMPRWCYFHSRAGDLLGSAIAEVAQQGVDAQFLDAARVSLAAWQERRP